MYIPRNLVASYKLREKEALTERWSSQDGVRAYKIVLDLIRQGAKEDFLLEPFEKGDLKILDSFYDLKGVQLSGKFVLAEGSNFEGIDLSYCKFWNAEINNANFISTFRFSNFYNCKFINCVFSFSNFFSSHFENVVLKTVNF